MKPLHSTPPIDEPHPMPSPGNIFRFTFDQSPAGGQGWHLPEYSAEHGDFCWTGPGNQASIELPHGEQAGVDMQLSLRVLMAISDDVLDSLTMLANGSPLTWQPEKDPAGAILIYARVPWQVLEDRPQLLLTLQVGRTVSPAQINPSQKDQRQLGLAINWIEIKPSPGSTSRRQPNPIRDRKGTLAFRLTSHAKNLLRHVLGAGNVHQLKSFLHLNPPASAHRPAPPAPVHIPVQQSSPPTRGITVIGYTQALTGVGEAARSSLRALRGRGIALAQVNLARGNPADVDNSCADIPTNQGYSINLIHVNADMLLLARQRLEPGYFEQRRNVGFWFWEMSAFPPDWQDRFACVDEVWVASRYVQETLAPLAGSTPVVRMPLVIAPRASTRSRQYFHLPQDRFIFMFVFDLMSILERKNPYALIDAYRRAFGTNSKATKLVIKVNNLPQVVGREADLGLQPGFMQPLQAAIDGVNGLLYDQRLSRPDAYAFIQQCDCYVSLHRCEGFGLTMAEAMYFGKPCIATGYSSNLDFMNKDNSFLVNQRLVQLEHNWGPYQAGWSWADADIDHAAALMRQVYEDRSLAAQRGAQAAADIRRWYSPAHVGDTILKQLNLD